MSLALLSITVLIASQLGTVSSVQGNFSQSTVPTPTPTPAKGFILRSGEGEVLQRAKGNTVTIKVDPRTGSPAMALGTQVMEAGVGIPVHVHEHEDEVLYVNEGEGTAVVENDRRIVSKGDTIFIPRGTWHGVETKASGISLLWVVTPPGLESFFREISSPPGAGLKTFTPAQINDIGKKHGVTFRPKQ